MTNERTEIRSLTGVRGVAALLVVTYHFTLVAFSPRNPLGPGYIAVDWFFVLSGFVMAKVHSDDFAKGWSGPAYAAFLQKRFARVYPLYMIATLVAFAIIKLQHGGDIPHPTQTLLTNLLAVQNLGPGLIEAGLGRSLNGATWSLSTESGAYLLFPWLAIAVLHRSWRAALAVLVLSIAGLTTVAVLPDAWFGSAKSHGPLDVSWGDTAWPVVRCLAGFSLGLFTYRISRLPKVRGASRTAWGDVCTAGGVAALWLVPGSDVLIALIFPLLMLQVCTDRSPFARALGSGVPYRLGQLSYAMYLIHLPALSIQHVVRRVLDAVGVPFAEAISFIILIPVTLAASWVAFNVAEKPLRRLLQRHVRVGHTAAVTTKQPAMPATGGPPLPFPP